MGIADEIRRLNMRGSAVAIKARERAAREEAERLKRKGPVRPPNGLNPSFAAQLQARARAVSDPSVQRFDLDKAMAMTRAVKGLPTPDADGTGYAPTPEEVLGDLGEKPQGEILPSETEDACPDPETLLEGGQAEQETASLAPATERPHTQKKRPRRS